MMPDEPTDEDNPYGFSPPAYQEGPNAYGPSEPAESAPAHGPSFLERLTTKMRPFDAKADRNMPVRPYLTPRTFRQG